jgi:hypothetical protein
MVDYVPSEKATPIRQPSTANLMIDSLDRVTANFPSAGDFQITKKQSLMNGFFTRIGMTEIVMNWGVPNIVTGVNDTISVTLTGTGAGTYTATLNQGQYTVANVLGEICSILNLQVGIAGVFNFTATNTNGAVTIQAEVIAAPNTFKGLNWNAGALQAQLGIIPGVSNHPTDVPPSANIQLYRYVDFVSNELTYAQDLKDSSTNTVPRDVIVRWYFSFDSPPIQDTLGFPILPGYQSLQLRRLYNPPKQIKWEPNLPIGNLSFQVYDPNGVIVSSTLFNWLMTLQVSEV